MAKVSKVPSKGKDGWTSDKKMKNTETNVITTAKATSTITNKSSNKKSIKLGEIGYKFVKHFPGYGYFTGTVVSIRPNARKCSCSSFISCMCCIQKLYMN